MTKAEAIKPFKSASRLAEALGISRSAVSQWGDREIPKEHELRIRYELIPAMRPSAAKAKKAVAA